MNEGMYGYESGVPYDGSPNTALPFGLTKSTWESDVYHGMFFDMLFTDLFGPRGSQAAIIYDGTAADKAGRVRIPMRRPASKNPTPNAIGNGHIINYGTPASSGTTDMSWAYLDVYSNRIRFAWHSLGKESIRALQDYGVMTEATQFLSEEFKNFMESEIMTTYKVGYSTSVTSADTGPVFAGSSGNAARVTAKTFRRNLVASTYDITGLTHPNEFFADEVDLLTTAAADTSGADMRDAVQTGTKYLTVNVLENLIPSLRRRKIQQVRTPWGMKWVMLVAPEVAANLRQDADFREQQLNAAPRSYTENVLWLSEVGPCSGFIILESQWIVASTETGATSTYPCYIIGSNSMAMSQPEQMSLSHDELDGDNWTMLIAASAFGFARADWVKDLATPTAVDAHVSQNSNIYDADNSSITVWNESSALLWVYAAPIANA